MRRAAAVLLLAGASLLALAPAASAHALLRASEPAAGTQLENAPERVTVDFTETPELSLSTIRVLDASGDAFERGRAARVPDQPKALTVAVDPLESGVYTVAWRVVSREDGHATAGSFAFGVGVPVDVDAPPPPGVSASVSSRPSAMEVAGRWVLFAGLFGLIGGGWVAAGAFGGARVAAARVAGWSWAVAVAGLVILAAAQWRESGTGIGDLFSTRIGTAIIWRAAGLAAAGLALLGAARSETARRRAWLWIAVAGAAGAAFAHVNAGHASAASPKWVEILAQWVHVVAASVWIGGLAGLLATVRGAASEEKALGVRRFSTVAAFALALVLATGVVRAFGELPRWSALWSTGYGMIVIVKSGLIVALAALGAMNRYRNVPRAGTDLTGLHRASRAEVAVGAMALVAASVLASVAPPAPAAAAPEQAGVVASGADFGTTVRVRMRATPGIAGTNRYEVRVTDYDSGRPITDARVTVRFAYLDDITVGETRLTLARRGNIHRGSGLQMSLAGRYRVTVLIERGATSLEVPLTLATRCVTRSIPGPPTIYVVDLGSEGTAQGYLDPGRAGPNEVHVTFFAPGGTERPISGTPTMRGSSRDDTVPLAVRRLGPGHFVADADLAAGVWRFDFSAAGDGGSTLRGCFTETVRG